MFTGIIQKLALVTRVEKTSEASRIVVQSGFSDVALGESVAVNGVCLTVTEFSAQGDLHFFISPETLAKTNLSELSTGSFVNLERALLASERLSGHIVQGHVDGLGRLSKIEPQTESFLIEIEIPQELSRYCVPKGSIAINGVSLTINHLRDSSNDPSVTGISLGITLIPHTWTHTSFSKMTAGSAVNLEVDVLAKYVERQLGWLASPEASAKARTEGSRS